MFLLSLQYNVNITNMPQPAHRQVSDRKSPLDVGVWQVKTDHEPQWAPCVEILTLLASIFRRKVQSHSMQKISCYHPYLSLPRLSHWYTSM